MSERPKKQQRTVLNTDALNQSLWLVKVPHFVATHWASCENNDEIGQLSIETLRKPTAGGSSNKRINVKLTDVVDEPEKIPTDFTLEDNTTSKSGVSFLAFSHDPESNKHTIDGNCTKSLILRPVATSAEYKQLIRERGTKAKTRRETNRADFDEVQQSSSAPAAIEFMTSESSELKRRVSDKLSAGKDGKFGTFDAGQLRSKMFEAFANNERQLFKDLYAYCLCVPGFSKEKDLRELLEGYAKYHSKGMYKQFWELKPEFKDYTAEEVNNSRIEGTMQR